MKRTRLERDCRHRRSECPQDEWMSVEFQPEGVTTRIMCSALAALAESSEGVPSNWLDRSFGVAALFSGQIDAADSSVVHNFEARNSQELRATLVALTKSAPRCSKHGPFGCSCTTFQVLGVLLRNFCEAFVENVGDENIVVTQHPLTLPGVIPVVAVIVDAKANALRLQCYGPGSFPFYKTKLLCDGNSVHTFARWDRLEEVESLVREGWNAHDGGFWKHKGFQMPTCSNCSAVTSVSATCQFCPKLFCKQCTTICPSCDHYRTCHVCLVNGLVLDRVSVRHCRSCAEQPTAKDGYLVTTDGELVMLKHPIGCVPFS
jgi:hypothetical protein